MAFEPLPIEEFDLDDLSLDLQNYRIPTRDFDEAAALLYLVGYEDVLDTAEQILRNGYFDNEVPIVVQDSGETVVLEGNRRVTALKILHNPDLVPEHAERIAALRRRYAIEIESLPLRIRALVVPTRVAAAQHVARLHTGQPKKPWTLDQQANYYYDLLRKHDVAELKLMFPGARMVRLLKMGAVRRFLSSAPFQDPSLQGYVAQTLTMSAFEYAYKMAEIRGMVGIAFSADGLMLPTDTPPETIGQNLAPGQLRALEVLVSKFRGPDGLNTRSPEFKRSHESNALAALLTELASAATASQAPNPPANNPESNGQRSEAASSASPSTRTDNPAGLPVSSQSPEAHKPERARLPNRTDTYDRLLLNGIPYDSATVSTSVRDLYNELGSLSLSRTPIATAVMLRVVLEATIKHHFRGTDQAVSGTLNECLKTVYSCYAGQSQLKNAINTLRSGNAQKPGSLPWLNLAPHTAHVAIGAEDVRSAMKTLEPLLTHLLHPYRPVT